MQGSSCSRPALIFISLKEGGPTVAHKKNIAITNWILKDSVGTSKRIRMS